MFAVRGCSAADATSNESLFKLSDMAFCLDPQLGGFLAKWLWKLMSFFIVSFVVAKLLWSKFRNCYAKKYELRELQITINIISKRNNNFNNNNNKKQQLQVSLWELLEIQNKWQCLKAKGYDRKISWIKKKKQRNVKLFKGKPHLQVMKVRSDKNSNSQLQQMWKNLMLCRVINTISSKSDQEVAQDQIDSYRYQQHNKQYHKCN